jgi:hypothetical protein
MQQPPSSPPQWSPDGLWWWDGSQWRPRGEAIAPAAPTYGLPPGYSVPSPGYPMPPPVPTHPTPGLRIVLIVALSIAALMTGFLSFGGAVGVSSGASTPGDIGFLVVVLIMFAVTLLALVGSLIRARWARWAAIVAGIAITLTCIGALVGIPILVTAARAPDLTKKPA